MSVLSLEAEVGLCRMLLKQPHQRLRQILQCIKTSSQSPLKGKWPLCQQATRPMQQRIHLSSIQSSHRPQLHPMLASLIVTTSSIAAIHSITTWQLLMVYQRLTTLATQVVPITGQEVQSANQRPRSCLRCSSQ